MSYKYKVEYTSHALKQREWAQSHDKILFAKIVSFDETLAKEGRILIGKPKTITNGKFAGCISVKLDKKNRYLYFKKIDKITFLVVSCLEHYDDR